MNKIDIVVPVLNEAQNLPELVKRISSCLKKSHISYGILLIDDHSQDNTKAVFRKLAINYPIRYLLKNGKQGKAYSILQGAKSSPAEYVAMIDGDLQYPPEYLPQMLAKASEENLGIVI